MLMVFLTISIIYPPVSENPGVEPDYAEVEAELGKLN